MTASEWRDCSDPGPMLASLGAETASERKCRLFVAACCRRWWALLPARSREAVAFAEGLADGKADATRRRHVSNAVHLDQRDCVLAKGQERVWAIMAARSWAAQLACLSVAEVMGPEQAQKAGYYGANLAQCVTCEEVGERACTDEAWSASFAAELSALADLLRDLFAPSGPPPAPAWHGDFLRLAVPAYEERHLPDGNLDPVRIAVLADALEEAGASPELQRHLRGTGPHVRGCWALDQILAARPKRA
jgi:hypothetical protein